MEPTIGEVLFYIFAGIGAIIFVIIAKILSSPSDTVEWVEEYNKKYGRWR